MTPQVHGPCFRGKLSCRPGLFSHVERRGPEPTPSKEMNLGLLLDGHPQISIPSPYRKQLARSVLSNRLQSVPFSAAARQTTPKERASYSSSFPITHCSVDQEFWENLPGWFSSLSVWTGRIIHLSVGLDKLILFTC